MKQTTFNNIFHAQKKNLTEKQLISFEYSSDEEATFDLKAGARLKNKTVQKAMAPLTVCKQLMLGSKSTMKKHCATTKKREEAVGEVEATGNKRRKLD